MSDELNKPATDATPGQWVRKEELDKVLAEVYRLTTLLTVAEAKAAVIGGEWCRQNRAEGRGPCGACALCVSDLQRRVEAMDTEHRAWHKMADKAISAKAEVARLTQERDGLRGLLREACDELDSSTPNWDSEPQSWRSEALRRKGGLTDGE